MLRPFLIIKLYLWEDFEIIPWECLAGRSSDYGDQNYWFLIVSFSLWDFVEDPGDSKTNILFDANFLKFSFDKVFFLSKQCFFPILIYFLFYFGSLSLYPGLANQYIRSCLNKQVMLHLNF